MSLTEFQTTAGELQMNDRELDRQSAPPAKRSCHYPSLAGVPLNVSTANRRWRTVLISNVGSFDGFGSAGSVAI